MLGAVRLHDPDLTGDMQGPVPDGGDSRFAGSLVLASVQPSVLQSPTGAAADNFSHLVRLGAIGEDPGAAMGIENGCVPPQTLADVDAQVKVKGHLDFIPAVDLSHFPTRQLTLRPVRHRSKWLGLGRAGATFLILLVVLAVAGSDLLITPFWLAHPMLTAVVSALVVVVLSVTVIDAVLHRRSERRWRILAQGALIELAEGANATWTGIATGLGIDGATDLTPNMVTDRLASTATGPGVRGRIEGALANRPQREALAREVADLVLSGRAIVGRWAIAMTGSETYAEVFDQHVELLGRVQGLQFFLEHGYRQSDPRGRRGRPRREYLAPGGEEHDDWFVDNVVTTMHIAATLEDETWDLALRVVPEDWWNRRTTSLAAATRARRN